MPGIAAAASPGDAGGARSAVRFVVLLGVVSLLSDMTYEGARSIAGPFLGLLGATALAVSMTAGLGELLGYGLRLVAGVVTDRTRSYWPITIAGYAVNLLAVPLLALAGRWEAAVVLMVTERVGKAIRSPARDAMLSHAASRLGRGWGFGLHEAMDQIGALTGPLLVAAVIASGGGYRSAYAWLAVPAVLALAAVTLARFAYPRPRELEPIAVRLETAAIPRNLWLFLAASAFIAAGYADFALMAFHLQRTAVAGATAIPLLYAGAMGVDAVAALLLGRLFDRHGVRVIAATTLIAAPFAPLVFLGGPVAAVIGIALWGIGLGAQESVVRAAVAAMAPAGRRATAFGVFNAVFGMCWFAGSALLGVLYGVSLTALAVVSAACQLAAVPLLLRLR